MSRRTAAKEGMGLALVAALVLLALASPASASIPAAGLDVVDQVLAAAPLGPSLAELTAELAAAELEPARPAAARPPAVRLALAAPCSWPYSAAGCNLKSRVGGQKPEFALLSRCAI